MIVSPGATNVSIDVQIVNDSGIAVTGLLAANWPPVALIYGANEAALVLSDLSDPDDAHVDGGVLERSGGGGWYRLDAPDAPFASAIPQVVVCGEASGKHVIAPTIQVKDLGPVIVSPSGVQNESELPTSTLYARTGENKTHAVPVVDTDGNDVDITGFTLRLCVEALNNTDLAVVEDASITKSANTATFTVPASGHASEQHARWSLRKAPFDTDNSVLADGEYIISRSAEKDA